MAWEMMNVSTLTPSNTTASRAIRRAMTCPNDMSSPLACYRFTSLVHRVDVEDVNQHRVVDVALHVVPHGYLIALLIQVHVRRLVDDDALGLLVQPRPLLDVRADGRAPDEPVHFRIGVERAVARQAAVGRVEPVVHE